MSHWKTIRLGIVGLSFVLALFGPATPAAAPPMTWFAVGVIFAIFPIAMLVGFGILFILRGPRFDWQRPSWEKNPFNFAHGEQFFHLGAFVMLSTGAATVLRALATTSKITPDTLVPISMGAGVWIGLRILTAAYRRQVRNGT
ncbi:hypothetical protein GCM10007862_34010 [Dyella lipolytica]|uniref:Uncharacterized protein n=1 Tax=Dyella lipolytica TaxID=1867835 RepID=A0ABW8IWY0_9GAMM|nr:hypothetical protein [Dyella lipolytica]GLQ48350.1 hypothetical protein GCM10007862_34010 [Dyella lipolytica]